MSKQSDKVKKWRENCKKRIVESMGGQCVVCGYNRCNTSLALHHLDSNEKDFGMGQVRANPKSWSKIVNELRKCVLVCHNCHYEIHEELITLPKGHTIFNEEFVDYKELEKTAILDKCLICDKLKPEHKKLCSNKCSLAYANTFNKNHE